MGYSLLIVHIYVHRPNGSLNMVYFVIKLTYMFKSIKNDLGGISMLIYIYILIAYFSIFIHEIGHYSIAYLFGIKATDVITGMGIKLFSFKTNHTRFTFNLIPSGGVTVYNLQDQHKLNPFQQIMVLLGGGLFNYFTAIIASPLYYQTSLIDGFKILNEIIMKFIISLSSILSIEDFLVPKNSFTKSLQLVANENSLQNYILFILIFMNVLLFLFNLIPIPFFDGGQIFSILTDPFLLKLGMKEQTLEQIKTLLNKFAGYFLIFLIIIPFIMKGYQYLLSYHSKLKILLFILGAILIKRMLNTLIKLIRTNKP